MLLTIGITFFSLFLSAFPVPLKRARAPCSNGRSASSETCCVWFDVLDDIQQHLCVTCCCPVQLFSMPSRFDGGECGRNQRLPVSYSELNLFV
jgi:hypothetical protein